MNINELKEIREKNFNKWFERWLNRKDLDKTILISNEQGLTVYTIDINGQDERDKRMMLDPMFLKMLRNNYPQLKIYIEKEERRNLLNTPYVKNTLIVSWAE